MPLSWQCTHMSKFDTINRARKTLGLPECASMAYIKANYRELLYRWHPDRCPQDPQKAAEKTRQITEAYKTLIDYCNNYRYCFSEQTVKRHRSPGELWIERFGDDPVWGKKDKSG